MNQDRGENFIRVLMHIVLSLMIVVLVLLIPPLTVIMLSGMTIGRQEAAINPTSAVPVPTTTSPLPPPTPTPRIVYESDPANYEHDKELASRFTQKTGIEVDVTFFSANTDENYKRYKRLFAERSPAFDVLLMDVVWGGEFAPHLVDLQPELGQAASEHYPSLIDNNLIAGRLIAMPLFGNFGVLYYRQDLLEKYGFSAPPGTWQELTHMAQVIQDGERADGRTDFTGFVFQGKEYEGLTCNALEWIASNGGSFVTNGAVAINSPQAAEILTLAQAWKTTIAQGVTGYGEEETLQLFRAGNAAFMRNWPHAYAIANAADSPVHGKFEVAPLPAAIGHAPVGTVGGGQLGVSNYSRNKEAAIAFVRYMTSAEAQAGRAKATAFIPTIPSVVRDPEVIAAMPFLDDVADVIRVTRPSSAERQNYEAVSAIIYRGVSQILNGEDVTQGLAKMEEDLKRELRKQP